MLDQKVAEYVAKGYAVESRTDTQAVVSRKKKIGLVSNGLMTLLTGGIWLVVVAYKVINRKTDRVVLTA